MNALSYSLCLESMGNMELQSLAQARQRVSHLLAKLLQFIAHAVCLGVQTVSEISQIQRTVDLAFSREAVPILPLTLVDAKLKSCAMLAS